VAREGHLPSGGAGARPCGVLEYLATMASTAPPTRQGPDGAAGAAPAATALERLIDQTGDPQSLVDAAWRILSRVQELATDPHRYKVEFVREGCEIGDLNLVEIGINRFYDVDPGEDDGED
jgi:hypothetical protein